MKINLSLTLVFMALTSPIHISAQEDFSQQYLEICLTLESKMPEAKQLKLCRSVINIIVESGIPSKVERALKMAEDGCAYEGEDCDESDYVKTYVVKDNLVFALCEYSGFDYVVDEELYSSLGGIVYRDGSVESRCNKNQLEQTYPFHEMDPVRQESEYSGENHRLWFANLYSILNDYKPKLFDYHLAKVDFSNSENKEAIIDLLALAADVENDQPYSLVLGRLQFFDNPDDYYNQPLGISINAGKTAGALKLLSKNASAKGAVSSQQSYLYVAAGKGDLELVKQLLAKGANVNGEEFGVNKDIQGIPLSNALANKHFQIVEELLANEASVATSADFDSDKTIMTAAMQSGHLELFNKLHKQGASIPEGLKSNMPMVLQGGDVRILERLFELGFRAELQDQSRMLNSYLDYLKEGNIAAVDMLRISFNNGFSVTDKDDDGFSYIQRALRLFSRSYIDNEAYNAGLDASHKRYVKLVVEQVQKNKPSTLTQIVENKTLLMAAARDGMADIVELLLNAGIDKTIIYRKKSALDMAREGRERLVKAKDAPEQLIQEFEKVIALLEK